MNDADWIVIGQSALRDIGQRYPAVNITFSFLMLLLCVWGFVSAQINVDEIKSPFWHGFFLWGRRIGGMALRVRSLSKKPPQDGGGGLPSRPCCKTR